MMPVKVCVVGAGVVGLSCALKLLRTLGSAVEVTVVSDGFGTSTTSYKAAGVFRMEIAPSVEGYTGNRGAQVSMDIASLSYQHYSRLLKRPDALDIGIIRLSGYRIYTPSAPPVKGPLVFPHVGIPTQEISDEEVHKIWPNLPKGCVTQFQETFLVSCRRYLAWLTLRLREASVNVTKRCVSSFDELFDDFDIIMNCTGYRAGDLTGDPYIKTARGQIIRVRAPCVKFYIMVIDGSNKPTYMYPTPDGLVLGGTKQVGDTNPYISKEDREHIITSCQKLNPSLEINEETIMSEEVGFRPHRHSMRLEKEPHKHKGKIKWVVHNYGHDDWGVSSSWGSACIAVELVESILTPNAKL